ncbi:MAG: glycosyltransferase family 1 protein [Terriglobia bacterium]|jgi:glycosyltransferase involved in cell wall biosynthesis
MKVIINAVSAKMGGAVTYLMNILHYLPPPESGHQFEVFLPHETAEKLKGLPQNVHLRPTQIGHARDWQRLWWEQVTLRRLLRREQADVLFSTANFGMWRCPVRQILLVRIPLYFSKPYLEMFFPLHPLKDQVPFRLRRWLCCQSVRWADIVMTPTHAMLDDLRRFIEVDSRKALVNHYGVAPLESSPSEAEGANAGSLPRNSSAVRLIYVSLYSEHKNLTTLLRAMPLLNKNRTGKFHLRTTVDPAWEGAAWTVQHQDDVALARQPDVAPCVEFIGPLNKEQTHRLYKEGDIFVFPPLCESFGHPMVEAMVHGLPIVASDTPVNREICGKAAVYFSPLNPDDLARQTCLLAADASLRQQLSARGQEQARTRFRWDTHVRRILEVVSLLGTPSAGGGRIAGRGADTLKERIAHHNG